MSIHKHIYLGYYFDIKPIKINDTVVYDGCPKCKKEMSTPFCPKCGSKCEDDLEILKTYDADVYDICEELGKEWEEYITNTDPMTGKNDNICIINKHGNDSVNIFDNNHFTYDFSDKKTPDMSEKTKQFVKAFIARFGENSIKVHYGLVIWYS